MFVFQKHYALNISRRVLVHVHNSQTVTIGKVIFWTYGTDLTDDELNELSSTAQHSEAPQSRDTKVHDKQGHFSNQLLLLDMPQAQLALVTGLFHLRMLPSILPYIHF